MLISAIFGVSLVVGIAYGAVLGYLTLSPSFFQPDMASTQILVSRVYLRLLLYLLNPLLLFALTYLFSRKLKLSVKYWSVILSLFVGGWLGHFSGYFSTSIFGLGLENQENVANLVIGSGYVTFFLALNVVFIGFTGASLAYLRTRQPQKYDVDSP